jgi:hypothetical protein
VVCSSIYLTAELVQKVFGREVGEGGGGRHGTNRRGELSDTCVSGCGAGGVWQVDGYECDGTGEWRVRRRRKDDGMFGGMHTGCMQAVYRYQGRCVPS